MRVLLFAGGSLFEQAFQEIEADDIIIGVDKGAWELVKRGYTPDIAIGDFDSVSPSQEMEITHHSKEMVSCDAFNKNKTDTEMGLERACLMRPDKLILYGVTGSRLDHTLANIFLLEQSLNDGVDTEIRDALHTMTLVNDYLTVKQDHYSYVSLIPLSETVEGVTLKGFLYPLSDAVLKRQEALGMSNQVIQERAELKVKNGKLLVIKSKE